MLQGWDPTWTVRRIDAAAAIDGSGNASAHVSGVSAVIERKLDGSLTLAALGPTDQIATTSRWSGAPVTDRRGCLLLPGLVNAHTHLDLTHIGPRPHDPAEGFAVWINMILRERLTDSAAISQAIFKGVSLLLEGGTVLVGDIAGAVGGRASPFAGEGLKQDGRINAVSYVEFFAQGAGGHIPTQLAAAVWKDLTGGSGTDTLKGRTVFGIQPHAPYSVGPDSYRQLRGLVDHATPLCTHLSESTAEHEFIASGTGPFRTLLEKLGIWDDTAASHFGQGQSPVAHMASMLKGGTMAAVHCNNISDSDLATLAQTSTPILYCARSSAYFGAHRDFGPHRYRDMLAAGITVALGTDSIVNLDTHDRISVWDEMRFLHQRDGTDPVKLLTMGTINGATALRRETAPFTLTQMGTLAGLVAIPLPKANPWANPSELLRATLADQDDGASPELLAIGRV